MSLELDLFFLRIMKEHSFFLEAAFTPKNADLAQNADVFARHFSMLLQMAVNLSNGVLSPAAIASGQYYTIYTIDAERFSQYYSGIQIDSMITEREQSLQPGMGSGSAQGLEASVYELNRKAVDAVSSLINFKTQLLTDVLSCRIFTMNYPLLIDHVLREAIFFRGLLMKLQNRVDIRTVNDLAEQEVFWNRIMAEHAKFIRGLLDPTEVDLFNTADMFGKQFDALLAESKQAQDSAALIPKATADSMAATMKIRDFKAAGTSGLLHCKIKSIIIPLLGDHVLREANHFIHILQGGGANI